MTRRKPRPPHPRADVRARRRDLWEWVLLIGFWGAVAAVPLFFAGSALIARWSFTVTVELAADPDTAFQAVEDPGRRLAWEPGLVAASPMKGRGDAPGDTRMLFLVGQRGRWHALETVRERTPPSSLVWTRREQDAERRIAITLTPLAGDGQTEPRTRLIWREEVRFLTWQARAKAVLALAARKRRLKAALARLALTLQAAAARKPRGHPGRSDDRA